MEIIFGIHSLLFFCVCDDVCRFFSTMLSQNMTNLAQRTYLLPLVLKLKIKKKTYVEFNNNFVQNSFIQLINFCDLW